MKKFSKIVLILIMMTLCICLVTACNDGNNTQTSTISINNLNMPQTVFVKGNDLDLSAGKLTFVSGGTQSEIAMNAEGVSVSGYDKNSVGEQTLTITYNGASTTLNVTVVERMVGLNHVSEYVVGEPFNKSGRLVITKDDGSSVTLNMKDSKLTFEDFDSSSAGEKQVHVVYKDGETELSGSFPVMVYAIEQVKIIPPAKVFYNSHDAELDLSGAYFSVTAKNGAIKTAVLLDGNTITGFNPTAVTEEEPVIQQQIHVDYCGFDTTFTVTVTLTDVTRVKKAAAELSALDWSQGICQVSQEQGELAIKALKIMNSLSKEDMEYITADEKASVLRPAAVWGKSVWNDTFNDYSILEIAGSYPQINCNSVDDVRTQHTALLGLAEDNIAYEYGDTLYTALATYSEEIFVDNVTYGEYLSNVCAGASVKNAIAQMGYMLQMYDTLSAIPADWQVSDLSLPENSAKIEEAHGYLVELGAISSALTDRYLFNAVSAWRNPEKEDFYEILYRYYYSLYLSDNEETSTKGVTGIEEMINLRMPGVLEDFYLQYVNTYLELIELIYTPGENGAIVTPAVNIDTLGFISLYRSLEKLNESVLAVDDEMIQTIYNVYGMGDLLIRLQISDIGYMQFMGAAVGEPALENIWTKYIDVISLVGSTGDFSGEVGAKIEDLYATFVALTPELQVQFISSLNPYGHPEFFPTDGTDRMTMFMQLFIVYYSDVLPQYMIVQNENEDGIVFLMAAAMQYYMFRDQKIDENRTYMNLFMDTIKSIDSIYNGLSVADKEAFDSHIGFMYRELKRVSELYGEDGMFVEGLTEEDHNKLSTLREMYQLLSTFMINSMQDYTLYPVFISIYESTVDLYNDIMSTASQYAQDYVLHYITDVFSDINATLETDLYLFRDVYISYLTNYPYDQENVMMVWNEYQNSNIREYFSSLINFYAAAIVDMSQMTPEFVKTAMADFCALTEDEKALFVAMDGDGAFLYFKALHEYFSTIVFANSSSAAVLADALIQLQVDSVSKFVDESEFVTAWEAIATQYANLSATDKETFDANLLDTYNYYKTIYDEIIASQNNQ